jgi:putative transposase
MSINFNKSFPRRPRLKDFDYIGIYAYFLTILTNDNTAYFKEAEVIGNLINMLIETARSKRFDVLAYCFMPDHLHLLVIGKDDKSNLKKFINLFKQKSGYWFKKNYNKNLWHVSYYDHVLRREDNIEDVIMYMLGNPVRKGIVQDFKEYPFSRSFL